MSREDGSSTEQRSTPEVASAALHPVPAWILSVLLHTIVLTVGAFTMHVMPRGVEEPGRGVGIVLAATSSTSGEMSYFNDATEQGSSGAASLAKAGETSSNAPLDPSLPGLDQMPQVATSGESNTLAGAAGLAEGLPTANLPGSGLGEAGTGSGRGASGVKGETTTQVFGVQGTGSRFIYVFDRSGSMSGYGGRPLAAAKSELLKSIASLGQVHQFQIVFYNEEPAIFSPEGGRGPNLCFADAAMKKQANGFVERIQASGGTAHLDALLAALKMNPDVIFFLTDANEPKLTEPELRVIRERNRRGAVINSVEFGVGPDLGDDNFLKRLAKQNRGQHGYVDVTQLPPSEK